MTFELVKLKITLLIITRNHVAPFRNIFKFCTFLSKFSNILSFLTFLNIFCPFFALFLKIRTHALGPERLVDWIRAGGNCVRVGVTVKYLKRGRNRKKGRGNKILKKGRDKLVQVVGILKRGENLFTNYGPLLNTLSQIKFF